MGFEVFRSFVWKMTFTALLLAALVLGSWVHLMTTNTRTALLAQKTDDCQMLLDRSAAYLSLYTEGIDTAMLNLSDAVALTAGDEESLMTALQAFQTSNFKKILVTACVLSDSELLCTKQPFYEVFGNEQFFACYRMALASDYQGIRWTEPYISTLSLARTVALYKPVVVDGQTFVLAAEINLRAMLSDLLSASNDQTMTWAVVSGSGQLISTTDDYTGFTPTNYKKLSRDMLETYLPDILYGNPDLQRCHFGENEYLILIKRSIGLNWTMLAFVRMDDLYAAVDPLFLNNLLLGFFHLLLLAVLIVVLGYRHMLPFRHIAQKLMASSEPFTLEFHRYAKHKNEVGVLARALNDLISRINTLKDQQLDMQKRQRELEISMLQAQIHPHFLGNTLACIVSLAKEGRVKEVGGALQALIKLLNYSIARRDEKVVLWDEMNCIGAYVVLRQMRSKHGFDYEVNIPNAYMSHVIPRLLLQPVIENAIIHGLTGIKHRGKITVTGFERQGKLLLTIEDNGAGASQALLDQVAAGTVEPSMHAHGIGMKNVLERLRLYFPDSTESRLEAMEGGGVRVLLDLGAIQQADTSETGC